jgi:3',5'-cyclic AMP phosphodiesterase CpdA
MAGLLAGGAAASASAQSFGSPTSGRRPAVTFAHLTDIHVKPEDGAADGMVKALRHAQVHPSRPAFMMNGGDAIFDALAVSPERAHALWKLWGETLAMNKAMPMRHCIGNHDIYGWNKTKSGASGAEPYYGKQWAMEAYQLESPYYAFDFGGWHFIVLDSCFPTGRPDGFVYRPLLDQEQFEWLRAELASVPEATPICVISHVPIVSACALFYGPPQDPDAPWPYLPLLVHLDARRIKDLFARHKNVKVCVSGHIHLVEALEYNGVSYYCNGAVCGDLWRGAHQDCQPGYAIVKLYDDGTSECEYVAWQS